MRSSLVTLIILLLATTSCKKHKSQIVPNNNTDSTKVTAKDTTRRTYSGTSLKVVTDQITHDKDTTTFSDSAYVILMPADSLIYFKGSASYGDTLKFKTRTDNYYTKSSQFSTEYYQYKDSLLEMYNSVFNPGGGGTTYLFKGNKK